MHHSAAADGMNDERARDLAFCMEALPSVSRTFALSIQALPESLRDAICVAYLLCRIVDTVEDDVAMRHRRGGLFDAFDRAMGESGKPEDAAAFASLARSMDLGPNDQEKLLSAEAERVFRTFWALPEAQRDAIRPHVIEMSTGMREYAARADTAGRLRIEDLADLERYCYFVAGTVGGLLTSLFLDHVRPASDWPERCVDGTLLPTSKHAREAWLRDRAVSFGLGLQIVNIVKDVASDLERGDCFLPEKLAKSYQIALERMLDDAERERGLQLIRAVSERARQHLERAVEYTIAWPRDAAAVRTFCTVPLALALATLREVEIGDTTLVRGKTPQVSRALVMDVFRSAVEGSSSDTKLAHLFDACRYGVTARTARPPMPNEASREGEHRGPVGSSAQVSMNGSKAEGTQMSRVGNGTNEARSFSGKVLLTGGAGHVGANVLHRLLSDGRDVRVFLLDGSPNEAVDAVEEATGKKVERVYGDLRDYKTVRSALDGCETAFHVAAKVSTLSGERDLRDLYGCNVVATMNILKAAKETKTERVVVTGSFGANGFDLEDPSKAADETVPHYPFYDHLPYARTKVLVEHECLKAVVDGLDVVIATSCACLGPFDYIPSRMGRTLVDFAHGKLRAFIPGGFEFVAGRDIADGHVRAMERGRSGQKYIFSTQFLTVDDIMDIFEEVSGRRRPGLRLPPPLMAAVAEVSSFVLTNFFPKTPQRFTPGAVRILRMQRHADVTKARTELGYEPSDIRTAIHEAYADFARRGLVPHGPTLVGKGDARAKMDGGARSSGKRDAKGVAA